MWVKFTKDWKVEDLDFTINLNYKCNLKCLYCPIISSENISISTEMMDKYVNYFINNKKEIYNNCNSISIVSWWECLLDFERIYYFIDKLKTFKMKFLIYTNWLLINDEILKRLSNYNDSDINFIISIDWNEYITSKNRYSWNTNLFKKILENIKLLKKYNFNFLFSKVILKENSNELFENFKFLHLLWPSCIFFLPASNYYKDWFNDIDIKNIIKWLLLFFNYLKDNWYTELEIIQYLWLPDNISDYKNLFQVDVWFFWDIDWEIYWILDWLKTFKLHKNFTNKEYDDIKIWNISGKNSIINKILNYKKFEKDMLNIWKIINKRVYEKDFKIQWLLSIFFIKKLLIYKYKPKN